MLAQGVEEQHQAGALGAGADLGADDPRGRQPALEQIGLEVVVQEVRRAARQQPDRVVEGSLVELPEAGAQRGQGPAPRGRR